jgi:glycosyltransferase involved in cell wall biosynthesis
MAKIRIAYIFEPTSGGMGRHVLDLVTELSKNPEFEVHLIHSLKRADNKYMDRLSALGKHITVHEVPMLRQISLIEDTTALFGILNCLSSFGPFDVVHSHCSKAGAIGSFAARLASVPKIVFTPHAYHSVGLSGWKQQIYQFLETLCGMLCHHIVVVAPEEKSYALEYKLAPIEKICLIYNGIKVPDLSNFQCDRQRIRQNLNLADHTRLIGSIGRLSYQKDPLLFIELAARRAKKYSLAEEQYVMLGEGELGEQIKSLVEQYKLVDRVHLLGFRSDVHTILAALDIYVMHSRYEGMPYAVLEAMGHALPIISTKVWGVTELLQDGGILTDIGDLDGLDMAIDRLLNKDAREQMGQANRQRLEQQYSFENMLNAVMNIYTSNQNL